MLPGILNQLGADSLTHLKRLASAVPGMSAAAPDAMADDDDDTDVPDLVENFDEVSKNEAATKNNAVAKEEEKISEVTGMVQICLLCKAWLRSNFICFGGVRYCVLVLQD